MSIDPKEFEENLYQTLAELAEVNPKEIADTDHLREDLGLDSLKSMELLSRISERYDVDPDMDEVMELMTVKDILAYFLKEFGA